VRIVKYLPLGGNLTRITKSLLIAVLICSITLPHLATAQSQYEMDENRRKGEKAAIEAAIVVRAFVERGDFSIPAINDAFGASLEFLENSNSRNVASSWHFSSKAGSLFSGRCQSRFLVIGGKSFPQGGILLLRSEEGAPNPYLRVEVRHTPHDRYMEKLFASPEWERRLTEVDSHRPPGSSAPHRIYRLRYVHVRSGMEVSTHTNVVGDSCSFYSIEPPVTVTRKP
jgi:hypothetical protein